MRKHGLSLSSGTSLKPEKRTSIEEPVTLLGNDINLRWPGYTQLRGPWRPITPRYRQPWSNGFESQPKSTRRRPQPPSWLERGSSSIRIGTDNTTALYSTATGRGLIFNYPPIRRLYLYIANLLRDIDWDIFWIDTGLNPAEEPSREVLRQLLEHKTATAGVFNIDDTPADLMTGYTEPHRNGADESSRESIAQHFCGAAWLRPTSETLRHRRKGGARENHWRGGGCVRRAGADSHLGSPPSPPLSIPTAVKAVAVSGGRENEHAQHIHATHHHAATRLNTRDIHDPIPWEAPPHLQGDGGGEDDSHTGTRRDAPVSLVPSLDGRVTMLVPPDMMAAQSKMLYQINKYYGERVQHRKVQIAKTIREVCKVVQDVLKEVEVQEPRFISSLTECNGRFEGLDVVSPGEFEVVLYLNQMGVFNFVDDGTLPGCAVLKLSDGRKRSMSLWVEFITASGYLSARKIRSRFQTLVAQACDKCAYRDVVKMIADTTEVKLRIRERYVVQITPAFKCSGVWPRSAAHWPIPHIPWPHPNLVAEVKTEGFDLLSKESVTLQGKQSAMEGDAWVLSFTEAENRLLLGGCRRRCLSILKTLRDRHLDLPGNPVGAYHLKTLLLYECEKHPRELEWDEACLGDRIKRDPLAAHLVPAVPPLSALFPAQPGPLQGQVAQRHGERRQAGVEAYEGVAYQHAFPREAVGVGTRDLGRVVVGTRGGCRQTLSRVTGDLGKGHILHRHKTIFISSVSSSFNGPVILSLASHKSRSPQRTVQDDGSGLFGR
uniref:Protein mab-21 n=1 Tax=Timema douglasi TaxID=61478 RepID=A0A7R8VEW5_TIMDO|nr:unnamed protein product [Timema douglasi]